MKTKVIVLHNNYEEGINDNYQDGIENYEILIFENEVEYEEVQKVIQEIGYGYGDISKEEYSLKFLIDLLTKKFGKLITKNLKSNNITITW